MATWVAWILLVAGVVAALMIGFNATEPDNKVNKVGVAFPFWMILAAAVAKYLGT